MHPIPALFLKELRQHRLALAVVAGALMAGVVLMLWSASRAVRVLTLFQFARIFLVLFVPLAGLVLANRLVTQEYSGRTHLFLEGLPIPRIHMVTAKLVSGLAFLLVISLAGLVSIAGFASLTEPIGGRFLGILILKSSAFVLCVWAALFVLGFLGRLRVPIVMLALLILMYLGSTRSLDFLRIGPLALLDSDTFSSERVAIGWTPLLQTLLASLACILLAYGLALVHEGSVAESLSRRMTQREKLTVATMVILGLGGAGILAERKPKEPYRFQGETVVRSETLPISILYPWGSKRIEALGLLSRLEHTLGAMAEALRVDLPPTRITYGHALDTATFETADLTDQDGLLVRSNYDDQTRAEREDLEVYLIHGLLDLTTRLRCRFEPKRWLHDGFPRWWVVRGLGEAANQGEPVLVARAVETARHIGPLPRRILHWTALREEIGEPMAEALAYSGLRYLEDAAGRDAVLSLARAVLGRRAYPDSRETLHEWLHPMARVFEDSTGMTWEAFLTGWSSWLEARASTMAVAGVLNRVPPVSGSIDVREKEGLIREIVGQVDSESSIAGAFTDCAMLHLRISPFDHELETRDLLREEVDCSVRMRPIEILGRYGPGDRVFLALEIRSTALDAPVRILSERIVIR